MRKPRVSRIFLWVFLFLTSVHFDIQAKSKLFEAEPWKQTGGRLLDSESIKILSVGAVTTATSTAGDFAYRDVWNHHQVMNEQTEKTGDFLGTGIPGSLIALGQYAFADVADADSHARALIATAAITHAQKFVIGRKRPGSSENRLSFPSGHTSTTFATATSLTMSYGWKVGAIAYPLALFTGFSRMSRDSHYFSDVVGGAFVGVWVARAAWLPASSNASTSMWNEFLPVISSEQSGFIWSHSF